MASDGPKPMTRGKAPAKAPVVTPLADVTPTAAAPAKRKPPVAKAKLPAPMLPEPAPEPTVATPPLAAADPVVPPVPIIPAAAVPKAVAAPAPVAAPKPAPAPEPAKPEAVAAKPAPAPVVATPEPAITNPQPDPAPVFSSVANTQKENIMEATMQEATSKTQAYFGDANDRAKAAMEKSAKLFEDMNEFGKGNLEAVVESGRIAAKGFESLGQEAAEYTRKQFEGATAMMKSFASVKSPTELFKMQSDYVRQSFDSMVAVSSKNTEALLKLAGEIAQPLSNRVALAAEKAKITA